MGIAILTVIVFASLTLLTGGLKGFIRELRSVNPLRLLLGVSLIILSEVVRAFRLSFIAGNSGYRLRLGDSLTARLAGRFASTVTPGGVAGTPTRAMIIGTASNIELGKALGITLIETFADTVIPATILLTFLVVGVGSVVVIIFAIFVLGMWIGGTIAAISSRTVKAIYRRLSVPENIQCIIDRQRELLIEALKLIPRPAFILLVTLVTIAAHAVEAAGIVLMVYGIEPLTPKLLIGSFAAVEASYILISAPTPGGSGAIEYGFFAFLGPSLALSWRLAHLLASLAPGAVLALIAPKLRTYIRGNAWGAGCE